LNQPLPSSLSPFHPSINKAREASLPSSLLQLEQWFYILCRLFGLLPLPRCLEGLLQSREGLARQMAETPAASEIRKGHELT
jgi:hypothetical protein